MTSSMEVSKSHCGGAGQLTALWTETGVWKWAYPVDVEDIDVACAQLLEGRLEREMERLHVVTSVGGVLLYVRPPPLIVGRILPHVHPRSAVS